MNEATEMLKQISHKTLYRGVDKSLARPGRKQATAIKPLQATQKNSEGCPSNQVSAAGMTSASNEKWRLFNCFFSRVELRTYQHLCTSCMVHMPISIQVR